MIFLDNASGIPLLNEVKNNIKNNIEILYNPSSSYSKAQIINSKLQKTRELISNIFNTSLNNVIFTSGATEANNLAINGYQKNKKNKYNLAYLGFEHNSIVKPLKSLKKQGFTVIKLDYNNFINNINLIIKNLKKENISFLVLSHIYSNIGILLPIENIVKKIKTEIPRIHIHIDMAQSFMKVNIKMNYIDSIAISGHKIGSLQGVGALILRNNQLISPIILGGKQNFSLRGGTENVLGILSLKDSITIWIRNQKSYQNILSQLNSYFRKHFNLIFNNKDNIKIITTDTNYCDNIITIAVKNTLSEHIIRYLDEYNILISSSSTCNDLNYSPPFLKAINLQKDFHNGIIRISFSPFNKNDEIDLFLLKLKEAIDYFM